MVERFEASPALFSRTGKKQTEDAGEFQTPEDSSETEETTMNEER